MKYMDMEARIDKLAREYIHTKSVVALGELYRIFIDYYCRRFNNIRAGKGTDVEYCVLDVFDSFYMNPEPYAFTEHISQEFFRECRKRMDRDDYNRETYFSNVYCRSKDGEIPVLDLLADGNVIDMNDRQNTYGGLGLSDEIVGYAVGQLSEKKKRAIELHYFMGYTIQEVAKIENVAEGTIKSRIHTATRELRGFFEDYMRETDMEPEYDDAI